MSSGSKATPASSRAARYPASRRRADSRSRRPARNPMRRCPRWSRCRVASRAPSKFWASTVGSVEPPTWGSTATTGCSTRDLDDAGGDEDDPVGERAGEPRQVATLPALSAGHAAGVDDELEGEVVQRPGGALQQLGAERLDVGHEDADDVGAVAAQAAGDEARLVAELLDHLADAHAGLGGDAVALVDHPRHRGDRHAGPRRDVTDRDACACGGAVHRARSPHVPSLLLQTMSRTFPKANHVAGSVVKRRSGPAQIPGRDGPSG